LPPLLHKVIRMTLLLASSSQTRARMLQAAGVPFTAQPARIDEAALRVGLVAEGASARDIAAFLAAEKARKVSARHPGALVLGSDQVLALEGAPLGKPETRQEAADRLAQLSGRAHVLFSAASLYAEARPIWQEVSVATLTMHALSPAYITVYLDRHWPAIADSVGAYRIEEEGVRLFSRIEGDHFTILGLPLLGLLAQLTVMKVLDR
jgi:septum formation protein